MPDTQDNILEELRRIRESLEPKLAPPPPPAPKGFMNQFMAFLSKYGARALLARS